METIVIRWRDNCRLHLLSGRPYSGRVVADGDGRGPYARGASNKLHETSISAIMCALVVQTCAQR